MCARYYFVLSNYYPVYLEILNKFRHCSDLIPEQVFSLRHIGTGRNCKTQKNNTYHNIKRVLLKNRLKQNTLW